MENKYELLTTDTRVVNGVTLYRLRALRSFSNIKADDLGGYIEKEENLSHSGDAWVNGDAQVYDNAEVFGDARVFGDAEVYGNAKVFGDAKVNGFMK